VQDFILLKPQSEEKYSSNGFNESVASFGPSYGLLLHATRNYITRDATRLYVYERLPPGMMGQWRKNLEGVCQLHLLPRQL
jgi:hypothetical protein